MTAAIKIQIRAFLMRKLLSAILLLFAAAAARAEPTPHWFRVRSEHFTVITDSTEKQARHLASQFERMRSLFQTLIPKAASDANSPIVVLALKDRKGFQSLEPAEYLAKDQLDLAGYFLRTDVKNYILLRLDAEGEHPYAVVYHEYTHFVLRKAEWIPLWLDEGLAEFYQNTDIEDKDVRLGQPSADDILYLRENKLLPLTTLLAVDHSSPYYHDEQKGSVFYAESWALTHLLQITDAQKGTHRLQDYAKFLIQGEDSVTAAQHAFGDLGQLQRTLDNYVHQGSFGLFVRKATITADENSFQANAISNADANSIRADVLGIVGRTKESRALLDSVLHDDPNNALAHETTGLLLFREQEYPAAKTWLGEAAKLDPQSYTANFYFAISAMNSGDRSSDDAVEASLRAAVKIEPASAQAYDALAGFYSTRHMKLDDAYHLMLTAVELDPNEMRYRLNSAQIQMELQQPDNAIRVLETALKLATKPRDIARIQEQLAEFKRFRDAEKASPSQLAQTQSSYSQTLQSEAPVSQPTTVTPGKDGTFTVSTVETGASTPITDGPEEKTYPAASASAQHHTIAGTVRNVKCSYPTVLTLDLDQAGKSVPLFTANYYKIAFTAGNYTPTTDIQPCSTMEGMKARIEYAEVTDPTVKGQIVSIELNK